MAWISSSNPNDAELPTTLMYPNVCRTITKKGETVLNYWLRYKNIEVA